MGRLAARPACAEPHPGAQLVCSALTQLSLRFKATPAISGYRTAAVLAPIGSGPPIVVSFESSTTHNQQSIIAHAEYLSGLHLNTLRHWSALVLPQAFSGLWDVRWPCVSLIHVCHN